MDGSCIWESGELVQMLVPVIDAKGTACMYDMVSHGTFYNKGTGTLGYEPL